MKTKDLVNIAMFTTLLAVCAWIYIPMTIPFTMQTLAVFLAMFVLGGKKGIIVVIVYLFLGLIGMPVFSGGTAGPGIIFGATGGYMLGWILIGVMMWLVDNLAIKDADRKKKLQIPVMTAGLFISYLTGTLWYMKVYAGNTEANGFAAAFTICVIPYIIPDLVKMILAYTISKRIKKIIVNV